MSPNKKTGKRAEVEEKKPVIPDPTFGLVLKSGYYGPSSFFPIRPLDGTYGCWMVGSKRISSRHQQKIAEAYRKGPESSGIDYLSCIGQIAPYSRYGEVCLKDTYQLVHIVFISDHAQRKFAPEVLKNAMHRGDIKIAEIVGRKYSLEIDEFDMPIVSTGAAQKHRSSAHMPRAKHSVRSPSDVPFMRRKVAAL